MSEPSDHPDDLPETDEPFELLGVDFDEADPRSLKKAYVALIKRYRPDRTPDEFMRIRQAYEAALAVLRWSRLDMLDDDEVEEFREAPQRLERLDSSTAGAEWSIPIGSDLDRGDISAAIDGFARAIAEERPLAAELAFEWLHEPWLARLVTRPELAWENLRKQDNRWAAIELLRRRFDQLILADDARVLAEIETLDFRRDLLSEGELEDFALGALVRGAWEGDARAPRLLSMLGDPTAGFASARHRQVQEAILLSESWQQFVRRWRCPPSLIRAFMMFGSVGTHAKEMLLTELASDLNRSPLGILRCLDALSSFDRRLVEQFFEAVDELNYDDESLEELRVEQQDFIEQLMAQAEADLRKNTGQGRTWAAATIGAVLCCVALPASVGYAAAGGLLISVGFWQLLPEYDGYYRNARPLICRVVAETGVSPDHLLDWIRSNARLWNRLRFDLAYEGDVPLQLFGDLARLCIAWRPS